jgi:phosphoglycerate dehydrogenase-like enzyme
MIGLAKQIGRLAGQVTEAGLHKIGYDIRPYDTRYTGASNFARITGLRTLEGATLGVVGMGEIGRELACRAAAFGMRVLYTQRHRIADGDAFPARASYCNLDELLMQSEYVSLNLPVNNSTRGIIDAAAISRMRPGAALLNVARADLIDRAALLSALEEGRIFLGADVWYEEPVRADDPILALPNVLLLPHTAIGHRENAAADLEEMCLKLWRGVTDGKGRH